MKKKTLYTLNIGNYTPEITELTYPFLEYYAKRIGANFHVIEERRYPHYHPMYEKLQIYDLAQQHGNDWNLYIDSDAFVNPDFFDITHYLPVDTVLHNGTNHAGNRWMLDRFFERDGRKVGCYDWLVVASALCIELWKPPDDLTYEEAVSRIYLTTLDIAWEVPPEHHIAEYICSRNIAKYGLKFKPLFLIQEQIRDPGDYYWHKFSLPNYEKRRQLCQCIKAADAIDYLPSRLRDEVAKTELDGAHEKPPYVDLLKLSPYYAQLAGKGDVHASHLSETS